MHMSLLIAAFLQSLGIAAIVSISYEMLLRWQIAGHVRASLVSLLFACAAVGSMSMPVRLTDGMFFDLRHVFIVLSASYGGVPAAIVTLVATSAFRIWHGGAGLGAGLVGGAISVSAGLVCFGVCRLPERAPSRIVVLGLLPSLSLISLFVLPMEMAILVLKQIGPAFVIGNFLGVVVLLGLLMKREGQYQREIELRRWALTDRLTGVANRLRFESDAPHLIRTSLLNSRQACLLIIDIDHFKRINDTFGHTAGDAVLIQVAELLESQLRSDDLLARYGGEEFVAVLKNTSEVEVRQVTRRICAVLAAAEHEIRGEKIRVTVSIGACVISDTDISLLDSVQKADAALYRAKVAGRNRVEYAKAA
ncbi:MAG: GGDEF domain-containing protein [Rhizobiales bacterium]|nr:GGDEF domain-containing protein [Hyphomicrobiales bacterium]|tara:strand:+ start:8507 stop:9598 length:1092 start_codon:yes stop_codon:yes gene_type:complete